MIKKAILRKQKRKFAIGIALIIATAALLGCNPPKPAEHQSIKNFRNITLERQVKYDYFAIPEEVLNLLSEGDIEMYRRVASAYFAGESEVEIPDKIGAFPNLWRLIDMYFPLFFADVNDESIKQAGGKISWKYTGTEADHEEVIDSFEKRIGELLSCAQETDSFIIKALSVYKTFTSEIVYDGTGANGEPNNSTHCEKYRYRHSVDAIMQKKGVCWCFARAYNFLLCQIGAESLTVHGLRADDSAPHEWTVFKYKDEWRYADPTWDIGGTQLNFFGFTKSVRGNNGYPEENVYVLEGEKLRASDYFDVSDTFFKPLYSGLCSGNNYELDHANGLIVFNGSNSTFDPQSGEYK